MADVFVSYSSNNRNWARMLSNALTTHGWTVWWDREMIMIGQRFHSIIESALASARSVAVIWSSESVVSDWVLDEAEEGRRRKILFPVKIDHAVIPFGFRSFQAADLSDWKGEAEHQELKALVMSLGRHLGGPREVAIDEAMRLIQKFCERRKVLIQDIVLEGSSATGTKFIAARAKDDMGYIYCHLSGSHLGEVYYVRKGIGIYYHQHIGGPTSALGLPVSNEELVDETGFPTSFFENGYIDWSPTTWQARAFTTSPEERPLGQPAVV